MRHNRCSLRNCGDYEIAIRKISRGETTMAMQENRKPGGVANNLWVQMVILVIVAVVAVALAAKYLW
jgi:hypothetical protein